MIRFRFFLYIFLAALFGLAPFGFEAGEEASSPWTPFIASFHPVLLHLPIGIFAAMAGLELLRLFNKDIRDNFRPLSMLLALSATVSFSTGYLLGEEGGYDQELLHDHLWAAGIFTSLSWLSLAIYLHKPNSVFKYSSLAVLAVSLLAASHPGGVIVHGNPFNGAPWLTEPSSTEPPPPNTAAQHINTFEDLVLPILEEKCVSCHGPKKKKGKLRLDTFENVMLGGDFGPAVIPGNVAESLFIEMIELPLDDEDHMPPEDEPQLTQIEISLLKWWITNGADADSVTDRSSLPQEFSTLLNK